MALIKRNWQETGRIVPIAGVRGLLALLFWIWALLGFLLVTAEFANLMARRGTETGVGIGSSAFVTMEIAYWTGGMVMLGIGALLARLMLAIQRPAEGA